MNWEGLVHAAKDAYEVGLENLNHLLCNISPVVMWMDYLELHVVAFDSLLELG